LTSSDGKDYPVHRMILGKQSDYFKKMFSTDMKEKNNKSVMFADINASTLKEMLKFIYTANAEIGDQIKTKDLLYAAEKFGIHALKSFCANKLTEDVTKENALEMLVTADLFNIEELQDKCLDVIVK
jgi:hypothetical protein